MLQGTRAQAVALAKERWAALHNFDIADESWSALFADHRPQDVIEAIKRTSTTRDTRESKIYSSLLLFLERLENERAQATLWPPADITRRN